MALQFPGLVYIDCDLNVEGPIRHLGKIGHPPTLRYISITREEDGTVALAHLGWKKLMEAIDDLAKQVKTDPSIQTIVIDGLTPINEMLIQKVLFEQGRKTLMEPNYWGPFKTHMQAFMFGKLRSLGVDFILTCHETMITKSKGGSDFMQDEVIAYQPSVNGGIKDYFGGFFTDIWRTYTKPKPGNVNEGWVRTMRTPTSELKNSLGMPSDLLATWENIAPFWERKK